jgi:arsenic resistance protein ArsH
MTLNGLANGIQTTSLANGDLNNTGAARDQVHIPIDESYTHRSFAIPSTEDDAALRQEFRPFLLDAVANSDWVAKLELNSALQLVNTEIISKGQERLKVLVLYGSLRERLAERSWEMETGILLSEA